MDFEIKEEPLYDTQFQLESGQQFIAHNGNGYESCEFCDEIFGTKSQKNLHIFEHFDQEICTGCDQRLIRIGASLFVLHTKMTCVKADNDTAATIEQSAKYPSNEIFIEKEMEPSVLLPIVHNMRNEERLPQGATDSIFFYDSKIDSETDILLDPNNYDMDNDNNNNLNDDDHLSGEKLTHQTTTTTTIDERDVNCDIRTLGRVVRKKHPVQHKKNDTIYDKNQQNLTCDICHKSTISSQKALKRHMRIIHPPKDDPSITAYTCDYCQIEKRDKQSMQRHMKQNHDPDYERPKCQICNKTFSDIRSLPSHVKSMHLGKRFNCNWCDKSFKSASYLKQHCYRHTGQTPYKCSFNGCSKAFRSKDTLVRHQFIHTNAEKQCKCDVAGCERLFFLEDDMKRHKRQFHMKRTILLQFVCTTCGKEFRLRSELIEHERMHTGERPLKCGTDSCGKMFRTKQLLSIHEQAVHRGIRRFKCTQTDCSKAYAHSIDLKRHSFSAHSIWPKKLPCLICNRIFPEARLLRKHMESHDVQS